MKQSEKLGLWLPEGSDPLEVERLSENFEKLDPLGSGIETIKEGTGPGSLFMVSKYYEEPIENALLCNGGTFNGAAYPELADVLGMSYGGSVTSELVNTQYGITSSTGYPTIYNADYDMYIAIKGTYLVLYQKGVAPKNTPPATQIHSDVTSIKWGISFGKYVLVRVVYGSGELAGWYDITTDTWTRGNADGSTHWSHNNSSAPVIFGETSDKIVVLSYGGVILASKNDIKSYSSITAKDLNGNAVTLLSTVMVGSVVVNLDDDAIYFLKTGSESSSYELYRFESVAAESIVTKTNTLTYTSYPISSRGCVIFNGYLYAITSSRVTKYDLSKSSATVSATTATVSVNGPLSIAVRLTKNSAVISNANNSSMYVLENGNASSISFYPTVSDSGAVRYGKILTTTGVRSNLAVANIKLPNITLSEALVYMRTR